MQNVWVLGSGLWVRGVMGSGLCSHSGEAVMTVTGVLLPLSDMSVSLLASLLKW